MNAVELVQAATNPVSLAALALALVFVFLGGKKSKKQNPRERWLFLGMAALCLVGALALGLWRRPVATTPDEKASNPVVVIQPEVKTKGSNSPAVVGAGGDVKIDIRDTSGTEGEPDDKTPKP